VTARTAVRHPGPDIRRHSGRCQEGLPQPRPPAPPRPQQRRSRAIDRFRRITEAYEYLSAHLKDNAHGNGHSSPGPAAPPRADAGVPGGYSEATSRVPTMLEQTWQAIRARHPEIPPVVIIIASGTTGRDPRWGRFDPQRRTVHTTDTLTKAFSFSPPVPHLRGWYGERRPRPWQSPSVASPLPPRE
jgi:hypothetical protein